MVLADYNETEIDIDQEEDGSKSRSSGKQSLLKRLFRPRMIIISAAVLILVAAGLAAWLFFSRDPVSPKQTLQ